MKVVGIIAEYNPFHKGHEYQIRYAREILGADYIVIAMSGDFVQEGLLPLWKKHLRAEIALLRRRQSDPKCRYRQQRPVRKAICRRWRAFLTGLVL